MKKGLFILMIAFCTGISARAQSFSLEVGSGLPSLYVWITNFDESGVFHANGQWAVYKWTPTLSISAVWQNADRWEVAISCSVAQRLYDVTQYPEFGTDPYGNPRYDFNQPGQPLGTKGLKPVETLYLQGRYFWLGSDEVFSLYSAFGAGAVTNFHSVLPAIGITPLAFRISGKHFYFFAEATVSPLATFGHGGFGWRF